MKDKLIPYLIVIIGITWFVYQAVILIKMQKHANEKNTKLTRQYKRKWFIGALLGFGLYCVVAVMLTYLHFWLNS